MACILAVAAEAVITTVITKAVKAKEKKTGVTEFHDHPAKIPFSRKLTWLNNLLWGGTFLLAFEHIWHGEIVPWFPFLTAAENPVDFAEMLREIATVGTAMSVLLTTVWVGMVLVSNAIEKRAHTAAEETI